MCDSKVCPNRLAQEHRLLTLQEEVEEARHFDVFETPPPLNTFDDMYMAKRQADRRWALGLRART